MTSTLPIDVESAVRDPVQDCTPHAHPHNLASCRARARAALSLLFMVALAAGCQASDRSCSFNKDCYAGEQCKQAQCVELKQESSNNETIVDLRSNSTSNDEIPDQGERRDGFQIRLPDLAPDASDLPDLPPVACSHDPFDGPTCHKKFGEPNEIRAEATLLYEGSVGCLRDEFTLAGPDSWDAQLCMSEEVDYYSIRLETCRDKGLVTIYRVELAQDCDPSVVEIAAVWNGKELGCEDERIRCKDLPNGIEIQIIHEATSSSTIFYPRLKIASFDRRDIHFDYKLTASVKVYEE